MRDIAFSAQTYSPANEGGGPTVFVGNRYAPPGRIRGFNEPIADVGGLGLSSYFDNLANDLAAGSWKPLLDTLTGAEQQRAIDLTKRIAELNSQLVTDGTWTQDQADQALANLAGDNPSGYITEVLTAATDGGKKGLDDLTLSSLDTVSNLISDTASGTLKIVSKIGGDLIAATVSETPWWLWVGAIAAGAWWLGLFSHTRNAFAKR